MATPSYASALDAATKLVDSTAELVPKSVPRPLAKAGVTLVGIMIIVWLVQKVLSILMMLAVLAGIAYFLYQRSNSSSSGGGSSSSSSGAAAGRGPAGGVGAGAARPGGVAAQPGGPWADASAALHKFGSDFLWSKLKGT